MIISLIHIWDTSVSQIYLDTIYDFGVNGIRADHANFDAMKDLGSGIYRTAFASGSTPDYELVITDFNLEGMVSNTVRIGDTSELFWPRSWVELEDDTVVLLSRYNRPYDTQLQGYQYGLMAFDLNSGEIHWQHEYGDAEKGDVPFGLNICENGDFVITGASYDPTIQDNDVFTIRVDHTGNTIWESYNGGSENDAGYSVYEVEDGGLLIGGRTRSFGAGDYDVYLLKLDSTGNEEWYETFGESGYDAALDMIESEGGDFLISGIKNNRIGLYLINEAGDMIWSNDYGDAQRFPQLYGAFELMDGSIIGYGLADNPIDGSNEGCAIKVSSTGNLVWERYYNRSIGVDYLTNGTHLDDGGFLFIGQARNTENNTSDSWVLVVDSMGCEYPECITGVDERQKVVLVDMWPNPASEVLNIQVPSGVQGLDMCVTDMTGKEVYCSQIIDQTDQIDVSSWSKGLYVINGQDAQGRSFSLNFVKE